MRKGLLLISFVLFLLIGSNVAKAQGIFADSVWWQIWEFLTEIGVSITGRAVGDSCYTNTDCAGYYCVHSVCREAMVYCGDGYCDAGENYCGCPSDCEGENRPNCQDCFDNCQCASGNCVHDKCCEAGKTCCYSNSNCGSGQTCGSGCYCTGVTLKSNGESCTSSSECSSGNCGAGLCCEAGKTCCTNCGDCSGDSFCLNYQCGSSHYCVPREKRANGQSCTSEYDCQSTWCYNSICCESGRTCCASNSQCSSPTECGSNYYCVNVLKKIEGSSCTASSECSSGNCNNNICCEAGKTCCTSNSYCSSGYICDTYLYYCKPAPTTTSTSTTVPTATTAATSAATTVLTTVRATTSMTTTSRATTTVALGECASGCYASWRGDGMCDSSCNNAACNYDSGDCASTIATTTARASTTTASTSTAATTVRATTSVSEKKPNYSSCAGATECSGGYCVHGYCSSGSTLCGDDYCEGSENYQNCPGDCQQATTAPACGNGVCSSDESCRTCESDCGKCVVTSASYGKADGQGCVKAGDCQGGYCVRGYCSSDPTFCGDRSCDFGENYRDCPGDCPAPPTKKSDGGYCTSATECESGHCGNNVCCPAGETCCVFDSVCQDGYCGDSFSCQPQKGEGESCSGYWMCRSKRCENYVCAAGEATEKVFEPVTVQIEEKVEQSVCGNNLCEYHLGENCQNCLSDCHIEGGCCSRDSLYVSLPASYRGVSEMRDSNEVGGAVPDHKAIFPHDSVQGGMSYSAKVGDLGYSNYKICCGGSVLNGDCCTGEDCEEGYRCSSNRCEPIPQCARDEDCGNTQVCDNGNCMRASKVLVFIPINYGDMRNSDNKELFDSDVGKHAETLKEIYGEVSCNPKFRILKSYSDCRIENSCSMDVLDKIARCGVSLGREFIVADYYIGLSNTELCPTAAGFTTLGRGNTIYAEALNPYVTSHEFGHSLGLTEEYCWIDWPGAPEPVDPIDPDLEHLCGPNTVYPNALGARYGCDTSKPKSQGGCCEEWCSGTVNSLADFRAHKTVCCDGNVYTSPSGAKGISVMSHTEAGSMVVGLDEPSWGWVDSILCG